MLSRTPSISVVIPLYNKADSILGTLASVAGQADADFEIVVVNDGSTDGSSKLLNGVDVPRLRVIEQENRGVSAARNRGVEAARAEWIAFLDADDVWTERHLVDLWRAAERAGDVIAAFSNVRLQSRPDRPLIAAHIAPQVVDDYFSFALASGGYPISASSILVRKQHLVAAGPFPEGVSIGEDIDTWCRLACGGCFVYTASPSAIYNDARSASRLGSERAVVRPLFAERLPGLIEQGRVPPALVGSSKRYANFLMLEYARQLLDSGRYPEARSVLLNECNAQHDWRRFLKRLARTTSVGQALFHMTRAMAGRHDNTPESLTPDRS